MSQTDPTAVSTPDPTLPVDTSGTTDPTQAPTDPAQVAPTDPTSAPVADPSPTDPGISDPISAPTDGSTTPVTSTQDPLSSPPDQSTLPQEGHHGHHHHHHHQGHDGMNGDHLHQPGNIFDGPLAHDWDWFKHLNDNPKSGDIFPGGHDHGHENCGGGEWMHPGQLTTHPLDFGAGEFGVPHPAVLAPGAFSPPGLPPSEGDGGQFHPDPRMMPEYVSLHQDMGHADMSHFHHMG